jgi:hypothetical protein
VCGSGGRVKRGERVTRSTRERERESVCVCVCVYVKCMQWTIIGSRG